MNGSTVEFLPLVLYLKNIKCLYNMKCFLFIFMLLNLTSEQKNNRIAVSYHLGIYRNIYFVNSCIIIFPADLNVSLGLELSLNSALLATGISFVIGKWTTLMMIIDFDKREVNNSCNYHLEPDNSYMYVWNMFSIINQYTLS